MKPPGFGRVAVVSKKDQVTKALRDAIVSGRMQPGDAIVESRVARQLGVGQPLVREALLDLEHQGFVQRVPYRGTSVTKLGPEEIDQIQRMRVELEALAVEWARGRVTAADLTELRGLVARMATSARDSDLAGFNDCDLALHRKIWELSGNTYLADALERAVVPLLTFFYLRSGHISELHVHSVEQHEALVEAIAAPGPALGSVRATLGSLRDQCRTLVSKDASPSKVRSDTVHR
jgi:DNA-binding GntR family transcriptional regulator